MAYAIVRTVRPNANDTPSSPIPTSGNAAASTALPQPPNTSQNVPISSAVRGRASVMVTPSAQVKVETSDDADYTAAISQTEPGRSASCTAPCPASGERPDRFSFTRRA